MTGDAYRYTVAMCNLNNAAVLEKSIRSVADQLDPRFELLVVDDGSTDGSLEILEDLESEYPFMRVIEGDNDNLGEARNHSFREASGTYVLESMDPDDMYGEGIQDFVFIFERLSEALDRKFYLKGRSINMAPRSLLLNHPYRSLGYGEDKDLWRRLFTSEKIIWLDHRPFYNVLRDDYERRDLMRNEFDKTVVEFRSGITFLSFVRYCTSLLRSQPKIYAYRLAVSVPAFIAAVRKGRFDPPTDQFSRMGALERNIETESKTAAELEVEFDIEFDRDEFSERGLEIFFGTGKT